LLEKTAFNKAEISFKKFQYDYALLQYKNYIKKFPQGYFLDDAIFQIAEIYKLRENYFMAIRHYLFLQKRNTKTDLLHEVNYKLATCYFLLGRYRNALSLLESNYYEPNDNKRLWEILFLMGRSLEEMDKNLPAFKKYLNSLEIVSDEKLKQKSKEKILELLRDKFELEDLINLSKIFSGQRFLGYILYRISEIYESRRDYTLFQKYINMFLNNFPQHEYFGKGRKRLIEIQAISSEGPIKTKIGVVLPLSGEAADRGQKVLQGIQMAFNLIPANKRKKIDLVVRDTKGKTETIDAIMEEFGKDRDLVALIGPMISKIALSALEKSEIYQLPIISPSAAAKNLPDISPYFFRNCLTFESQGKTIVEYSINNLEIMKFVMLYPTDLNYTRIIEAFLKQVRILGGEVLAGEGYLSTQNDFKKQILSIGGMNDKKMKEKALEIVFEDEDFLLSQGSGLEKNEKKELEKSDHENLSTVLVEIINQKRENLENSLKLPVEDNEENKLDFEKKFFKAELGVKTDSTKKRDSFIEEGRDIFFKPFLKINYGGIFMPGNPDTAGLIAPQLAFYNIKNVQLLGGSSWNSDRLSEIGGEYVDGAIFVDGFFHGSFLKQAQDFEKNYEFFYGETPEIFAAQAFDAAKMVFDIVLKGKKSRAEIKNALMEIKNFKGVSGETTILPNGDSEKALFFISINGQKREQVH